MQLGFPEHQSTIRPPEPDTSKAKPTPLPKGLSETAATAAVTWGNAQGYDPDAVRDLQKALSVPATGVYDRETAIAVFNAQSKKAKTQSPAKADRFLFMQLGLIAYKDQELAPGDGTAAQLKKIAPNGINVGIATDYKKRDGDNIEITRKSEQWAQAFNGVGISGGTVTVGTVTPIKHIEEVVSAVRTIHNALLAAHRAENPTDMTTPAWCKIRNLALFSHGMEYGLSLDEIGSYSRGLHNTKRDGRASNVDAFVRGVSGALTKDVQVQLFACNTGRDLTILEKYKGKTTADKVRAKAIENVDKRKVEPEKRTAAIAREITKLRKKGDRDKASYREWIDHDQGERRGEGSFADELNLALESAGHESSVYAHTTAGHATENFAARVYGKAGNSIGATPAAGGRKPGSPHMFDVLYDEAFLLRQLSAIGVVRASISYAEVQTHAPSAKVASKIRELAWKHYKDSISKEHHRSSSSKRYSQPIGRLMFMDPPAARTLLHADFATWAKASIAKIRVPTEAKTTPAPADTESPTIE
jgi:hypothetical protein